jgi:transcriptional regulator with XRE-family HTH domain
MTTFQFSSTRLIALRKLKGMSQEKLATEAGINIRTLQRLEKNEAEPQPHTVQRLAEVLGVSIEELTCAPAIPADGRHLSMPHFMGLLVLIVPLGNLLGLLGLRLWQPSAHPDFEQHWRAALNFQLSWLLYLYACLAAFFAVLYEPLGLLFLLFVVLLGIAAFIFSLISGLRVLQGKAYFYPLTIRFLK